MSGSAGATLLASLGNTTNVKNEYSRINEFVNVFTDIKINYFKSVYRPNVLFSLAYYKQEFKSGFNWGQQNSRAELTHDSTGDLLSKIFLVVELPELKYKNDNNVLLPFDKTQGGYTNSIGHALIDKVIFKVDEQILDIQYGMWFEIWSELTTPESQREALYEMLGKKDSITDILGNAERPNTYIIPINFWFCYNYGLALPLIALNQTTTSVHFSIKDFQNVYILKDSSAGTPEYASITNAYLLCEYVYLTIDDRLRTKNNPHVYLVDYVQMITEDVHPNASVATINLNYLNPVKSIYWVFREKNSVDANDHFNFSRKDQDGLFELDPDQTVLMSKCKIKINQTDMTPELPEKFYRCLQQFMRHTHSAKKHIYMYSWALYPEKIQPSSYINFSSFDSNTINLEFNVTSPPNKKTYSSIDGSILTDVTYAKNPLDITIFALTANIFVIKNGGGSFEFEH